MMMLVLLRKPPHGGVVDNTRLYGCGGIHINAIRIPTEDNGRRMSTGRVNKGIHKGYQRRNKSCYTHKDDFEIPSGGRYPPNILMDAQLKVEWKYCHHMNIRG